MIKRTLPRLLKTTALPAGALFLCLAGCGGGTKTPAPDTSQVINEATPIFLSRHTENAVSEDAKILAARETADALISLPTAFSIDDDLTRLRAAYPDLQDIHAASFFNPRIMDVAVKTSAPWIAKWNASAEVDKSVAENDLTTGEPALDALLKKYDALRVSNAEDSPNPLVGRRFVLRFAQSLNISAAANDFRRVSPNLTYAGQTLAFVGPNNVARRRGKKGERTYDFFMGYGDCPSGCIDRTTRTFVIALDGSISEQAAGIPSPASDDIANGKGF